MTISRTHKTALVGAFGPGADADRFLPKAERKLVNPALFALGVPTLGEAKSVAEYMVGVDRSVLVAIVAVVEAPKARKVEPTKAEVKKYGYVRALIRANKAA